MDTACFVGLPCGFDLSLESVGVVFDVYRDGTLINPGVTEHWAYDLSYGATTYYEIKVYASPATPNRLPFAVTLE